MFLQLLGFVFLPVFIASGVGISAIQYVRRSGLFVFH